MSVPFTPQTAPRQGGKPGRKAKLSAESMKVLDRLLIDWKKHGAATLKILRVERPELYAKLAIEAASRLTLADAGVAEATGPMVIQVRWMDSTDDPMPLPPPRTIEHQQNHAPP